MTLDGLDVLLAEDNPTNQIVAVQMLEALGATVTLAANGADALARAGERRFDLALIDIEMPQLSGLEVIRRLRAGTGAAAEMPLIALTAYVMREHREAIDSAGADGVIAKPILSIETLAEDIRTMMDRRAGARAADAPTLAKGAPEGVGGEAGIDRGVFEALGQSIGQEEMPAVLANVAADLEALHAAVERGLAARDVATLRRATHSLVSVAGAIGATRLQQMAQCLNSAAHGGDLDSTGGSASELLAEIGAVQCFVRDHRGSRDWAHDDEPG